MGAAALVASTGRFSDRVAIHAAAVVTNTL
jgi:hypothetical protein